MVSTFTICFEPPFWVGVLERFDQGEYWIGRHVFGGEPTNAEVWEFARTSFARMPVTLIGPGQPLGAANSVGKNIKKRQREARRDQSRGLGTASQEALQKQLSLRKAEKTAVRRRRSEQREREVFALRQQRRKEKHRGR